MDISDDERGSLFQRAAVHECIVPIISKYGADGMGKLGLLSSKLNEHLCTNMGNEVQKSGIMTTAVVEVQTIATCLEMVTDFTDKPVDMQMVDKVVNAKAGVMLLVSQALQGQQAFTDRLSKLRVGAVAMATLGPELEEAMAKLQSAKTTGAIASTLSRLVVWQDSLPPGHVCMQWGHAFQRVSMRKEKKEVVFPGSSKRKACLCEHATERVAQEESIAWSQAQPCLGADSPESARLVPVVQQACADIARLFQESLMGSRLDVAFCSGVMAAYTTLQDHGRSPVLKCVCHFW